MGLDWQPHWDAPRPFVHPLRTPAGAVLSAEAPADHPWHHGLWSTVKFVNGENFWEEYDEYGLLQTVTLEFVADHPRPSTRACIEWRRPGPDGPGTGEAVIDEVRTLRHIGLDMFPGAYAIDWHVELTPRVDVTLDRTPYTTWGGYGGLTLRGAPDWTDTTLTLSGDEGSTGPVGPVGPVEQLRGERARWCHLQGRAVRRDGSTGTAGVAILDHPDNPRHPTPWYASVRAETYGEGWANFANAAFLWDEPLELAAGQPLVSTHLVVVHDDEWDADRVESLWQLWVD
jgi:hypothetical protein